MSDRTLEVHCRNCGARFVAWYGSEEDADAEVKDVDKCGLCGGDLVQEGQPQGLRLAAGTAGDGAERQAKLTSKFRYSAHRTSSESCYSRVVQAPARTENNEENRNRDYRRARA